MKYRFMGYFYPNKEMNNCLIEFPDLDFECYVTLDKFTRREMLQEAERELSEHLYIMGIEKQDIPTKSTAKRKVVEDGFAAIVETDTDKIAHSIKSIRRIDLS